MSRRFVPHVVAALTGVVSGIYIFKPLVDEGKLEGKTGSALGSQPLAHEHTVVDHSGLGLTAFDQSRAGDTK